MLPSQNILSRMFKITQRSHRSDGGMVWVQNCLEYWFKSPIRNINIEEIII